MLSPRASLLTGVPPLRTRCRWETQHACRFRQQWTLRDMYYSGKMFLQQMSFNLQAPQLENYPMSLESLTRVF